MVSEDTAIAHGTASGYSGSSCDPDVQKGLMNWRMAGNWRQMLALLTRIIIPGITHVPVFSGAHNDYSRRQ